MQAIEFESVVEDQSIRLPAAGVLSPGQPVRVVVMYEEEATSAVFSSNGDVIADLCANPLVLPDFVTLSRDATHER